MLLKPEGCLGCPLYGDGIGFVSDELVEGASVMVIGQNPGAEEEAQARPFVGPTGQQMERRYFPKAGLERGAVSIANAIRCRWQRSNELPPLVDEKQWSQGKRGVAEAALRHCWNAHGRIPSGTKLIVTQGEYSLFGLTGQRGVTNWRGWLLPYKSVSDSWISECWTPGPSDLPVLATIHLAALFHSPTLALPTIYDWQKVKRILRNEWPARWPGYTTEPPEFWPPVSAFDTEFGPTTGILERFSLYAGSGKPWVVEAGDTVQMKAVKSATVVMHNIEADLLHLRGLLGGDFRGLRTEDTMLMHSVLWSDLAHDLEFLGSMYARINRWKHLFKRNPRVYSGGDALGTWDVYVALATEMREDPQSAWIYRNSVFPLTPLIMEAEQGGLLLDQIRVKAALSHFEAVRTEQEQQAQAYTGYPINLGSSEQVSKWLYTLEKVGTKQRRKRGSV